MEIYVGNKMQDWGYWTQGKLIPEGFLNPSSASSKVMWKKETRTYPCMYKAALLNTTWHQKAQQRSL